jgi:hypothetical protein
MMNVVADDEQREEKTDDGRHRSGRRHQRDRAREQRGTGRRDGGSGNLARGNWTRGPLARIDRAVEIIVEIHAGRVEQRHRDQHQSGAAAAPVAPGEHGPGEDVGPHRRQVRHAAEPEQGRKRNARRGEDAHRRSLIARYHEFRLIVPL